VQRDRPAPPPCGTKLPLLRNSAVPLAMAVNAPEVDLGMGITLLCCLAGTRSLLLLILWHAIALGIE